MNISQSLINSFIPSNQEAAVKSRHGNTSKLAREASQLLSSPSPPPSQECQPGRNKDDPGRKNRASSRSGESRDSDSLHFHHRETPTLCTNKPGFSFPLPFPPPSNTLLTSAVRWSGISRAGDLSDPKPFPQKILNQALPPCATAGGPSHGKIQLLFTL